MPGASLSRAEQEVVGRLRKAGAVRAESAHRLEGLGRLQRCRLADLLGKRIVREGEPGTYYLDEGAWADYRGEQLRRAVMVLLVVAFLTVAMAVLTQP